MTCNGKTTFPKHFGGTSSSARTSGLNCEAAGCVRLRNAALLPSLSSDSALWSECLYKIARFRQAGSKGQGKGVCVRSHPYFHQLSRIKLMGVGYPPFGVGAITIQADCTKSRFHLACHGAGEPHGHWARREPSGIATARGDNGDVSGASAQGQARVGDHA